MNNRAKYRYLPCPSKGYERKVFRPNSERLVDACNELNRLQKYISELRAALIEADMKR